MSRLTTEARRTLSRITGDGRRYRTALAERERSEGLPVGWLVTGAVVVGLGLLAWAYLGPDLRRYMKIQSM